MTTATAIQHTPETTVHSVIATVKGLVSVMSREIELLRAMKIKEMSQLQEQKLVLVNAYEQGSSQLKKDPSFMQHLDPLLKGELRDVIQLLNTTVTENETALLAAKTSNERLMQAVVEAVQEQQVKSSTSYSQTGVLAAQKAQSTQSTTPMHLNQCL
ncbi:hypothetical protein WH96_14145 [Kiloniella spongiae]|uniref:Flagellar basal-body protein FlbY n=1 Tax=Kiloniella spongiae TaxID=1489064 RepID=A0A0H2MHS9_9PROT|nr:hypothetical protein [Kiloniella spongiae]KLN60307.1 hypothetical protein WH96_14145 [Kiloniella spongiae]